MNYPDFFDSIENISVQDPLSKTLGSIENGAYDFSYLEIVKSAGHSCPTVAGAYLSSLVGLKALFPDSPAIRGWVKVAFNQPLEEGVTGVISNVISHITGATDKSGFKGLQGKFARHSLMDFEADTNASVCFTRVDTGKMVDVSYDPSSVKPSPELMPLMAKMMQGTATEAELKSFGELWQDRVKRIFENIDTVVSVVNVA